MPYFCQNITHCFPRVKYLPKFTQSSVKVLTDFMLMGFDWAFAKLAPVFCPALPLSGTWLDGCGKAVIRRAAAGPAVAPSAGLPGPPVLWTRRLQRRLAHGAEREKGTAGSRKAEKNLSVSFFFRYFAFCEHSPSVPQNAYKELKYK